MFRLLLVFTLAFPASAQYISNGTCGGLPRIDVTTPQGMCVGIAAEGFRFPRTMVEFDKDKFILVDMGGWTPRTGSIWKIIRDKDGTTLKTKLFDNIDRPHGSAVGPDGLVYIGAIHSVFRFDPRLADPTPTLENVVTGLPVEGRHPLTAIVFDSQGNLYVNRGSASDNCEGPNDKKPNPALPCKEAEGSNARGVIRRYVRDASGKYGPAFNNFATGLRNSLAMAIHPRTDLFLQAENARDAIDLADPKINDKEQPREELNIIEKGSHYGWPYCYNNGVPSPEFPKADCTKYRAPHMLLPAHVAPLGMAFYFGTLFPSWYQGSVLVTYHGYREYGQKLVAIQVDEKGLPKGEPFEIINSWMKKGLQPMGAPVGVTVAKDGSVYLVEDKNGTVLRLFYDANKGNGVPKPGLTSAGMVVDSETERRCFEMTARSSSFTTIQKNIIDPQCTSCHGGAGGHAGNLALLKCDDVGNAERLTAVRSGGREAIVVAGNAESELLRRVSQVSRGVPLMPPGRGLSPEHYKMIEEWVHSGAKIPASSGPGRAKLVGLKSILKKQPLPSGNLSPSDLCNIERPFEVSYERKTVSVSRHVRLKLKESPCPGFPTEVFAYSPDFLFQEN